MDITSATAAASSSSVTSSSEASLADSFDTFLTLLTTQLKYQDPLEPMDSAEFTNQLVQFTEVEQSISTNKQLEQLIGLQGANQAVSALGYIGNEIEAVGGLAPLVDSAAQLTYTLPANADSTSVLIFNEAGQLVRTLETAPTAGKHTVDWDGKDSDGAQLPDGIYGFSVAARDSEQNPLEVPTGFIGKVTGTQTEPDGVYLAIGELLVSLNKVVSATKPAA